MLPSGAQPPYRALAFRRERRTGGRGCRKTPPVQNPMLLTIKDLSRQLNIKQSTLYLWAKQGKIPCQEIHSLIRFDPRVIDLWLRSFGGSQTEAVLPCPRHSTQDVDRLIEAAKRAVYTPSHGETITPSPTRKE